MLGLEDDLADFLLVLFLALFRLNAAVAFAVDHPRGYLAHVRFGGFCLLDDAPVAQHYQLVAQVDYFLEAVGDEDYRDALLRELAQRRDEDGRLALGEDRGRLVEDEQPCLAPVYLARYFRKLLVSDGHLAYQRVGLEVDAERLDGLLRPRAHVRPVESLEPVAEDLDGEIVLSRFSVEQDVLGRAETRYERELLVHHSYSGLEGVERVFEMDLFAVDLYLPFVAARFGDDGHPEKYIHQRRLAGPVFSDQPHYFPRLQRKANVLENAVAEVLFTDVLHFQ